MPKRSSKKPDAPAPADPLAPTPDGKNPAAVYLGRLGGKKGGEARARKLTKEQRSQIARQAAQAPSASRGRKSPTGPTGRAAGRPDQPTAGRTPIPRRGTPASGREGRGDVASGPDGRCRP